MRWLCTLLLPCSYLFCVTVSSESELNTALENQDSPIDFSQSISLTGFTFPVHSNQDFTAAAGTTTINGNQFSLNGNNTTFGLFIRGGTVTIQNLTFQNTHSIGGAGGNGGGGGGGGAGLGGALLLDANTDVTLVNPTFANCQATGGRGGTPDSLGGGGGGGLHGGGGTTADIIRGGGLGGGSLFQMGGTTSTTTFSGGGGGAGVGFDGASTNNNTGGTGGGAFDGTNGGAAEADGGNGGGGGGGSGSAGDAGNGGNGGIGGGGAGGGGTASAFAGLGGFGGEYGGGGGGGPTSSGSAGTGGNGGFGSGGGGGGSSQVSQGGNGGSGGFGGGGGGGGFSTTTTAGGTGGFGGGKGANSGIPGGSGGGGAGFGGAIFLREGASLTLEGDVALQGSSATGGASGGAFAGAGSADGIDIFMMSSSQLTFDLSAPLTLNKRIASEQSGAVGGGLTKRGTALLTLVGDQTYTGDTTIEAGPCTLSGSVITDVTVASTGSLSGNLTLKSGGDLDNSGSVEPGANGNGAITFQGGNYTHEATATLVIDITPDGADFNKLTFDTGTATLNGGTLLVKLAAGNYINGTTYEIINAPTTGTFANVTKMGEFADQIEIDVSYSSVIITIMTNAIHTHHLINVQPAEQVVKCLNASPIEPGSDLANMVEILGTLNNSQINAALTGLSAVRYGALEWINARNNSYIATLLSDRACRCDCGSVWVAPFLNRMKNTKNFDFLRRFDADAYGALIGADHSCNGFTYGASVGYHYTDLDWKKRGGGGNLNTYLGALYGRFDCSYLAIDASFIGGGTDNDTERRITFSTVDRRAKSDYWSHFFTAHLGFSSPIPYFEPFALVDYHYYQRDSFKESGANSLDLSVQSNVQDMLRVEAGFLSKWDCLMYGGCIAPYLGASYVGEFPLHTSREKASFAGRSCVINAISYDSSNNLVSATTGLCWSSCHWTLDVGYKGLFNRRTRINEGSLQLFFNF